MLQRPRTNDHDTRPPPESNAFQPCCRQLRMPSFGFIVRFPSAGGVAERFNALVLKTSEGESPPRVRISPPPPNFLLEIAYRADLAFAQADVVGEHPGAFLEQEIAFVFFLVSFGSYLGLSFSASI